MRPPDLEPSPATSPAEVVRVTDCHIPQLTEFIRQVWDPTATEDGVRRSRETATCNNPAASGEDAPTFLFLAKGRAIGHVGTIPIRLSDGGKLLPAHWLKGLMVLPEHRQGPVGFLLLKEAVRHIPCALAMVVDPVARRLFEACGFRGLGVLPNHVRPLRPGTLLRRLDLEALGLAGFHPWLRRIFALTQRSPLTGAIGSVVSGASLSWAGVRGRPHTGLTAVTNPLCERRWLEGLWSTVTPSIRIAPCRDASDLLWRYADGHADQYHAVGFEEAGQAIGLAVVRGPAVGGDARLRDIRAAVLSDIVFPADRPRVGLAVLAGAEHLARKLDADVLLCSASHKAARRLLRRRAFLEVPGNVHVLLRADADHLVSSHPLDDWWLTRGDSYADEVF